MKYTITKIVGDVTTIQEFNGLSLEDIKEIIKLLNTKVDVENNTTSRLFNMPDYSELLKS